MKREWAVFGRAFYFIATTHGFEQLELLPRIRVQRLTYPESPHWGVGLGWFHGWIHLGWSKEGAA
jgi:hypothetical protein